MLFLTGIRKCSAAIPKAGLITPRTNGFLTCGQVRAHSTSQTEKTFDKVLIANRGEIACRVMRTCKQLGIQTVAIHSEADTNALHVKMADEAVLVGPAASAKSYLNMDNVIKAVKSTGAQAVHPGYGFLSENMEFAKRLSKENVAFIGPNKSAIEAMGDKIQSKILAKNAGVNTIPGFDGEINSLEHALKIANDITYPVMVKASAGGGGKGMRIAWNDKEAKEAYTLCKQEALASFGDDRLLIEKYIDNPRHIEIQVMGDKHGNVVYLNERECSIQRRNQKVIEEAPSVFLDAPTRQAMGEQAVMLSKAVNYDSAGTVEFLVDSQRNFYFLEMNTRLQVEHPITEYITGVDLVEQMIRSASGHKLNISQSDIGINGWAIESRVYAEDSTKMLPSVGILSTYKQPIDIDNDKSVRVDTGVVEGSEISIYYDPMICKLCTYGKTRDEALAKMEYALDTYYIKGVVHNIPLLRDIISSKSFRSGNFSTKFIQEHYPGGFKGIKLSPIDEQRLAAVAILMKIAIDIQSNCFINLDKDALIIRKESDLLTMEHEYVVTLNEQDLHCTYDAYKGVAKVNGKQVLDIPVNEVKKWFTNNSPIVEINLSNNNNNNFKKSDIVVQYLDSSSMSIDISYKGSRFHIPILTPRQKELFKHMPKPVLIDSSKFAIAPMPGCVIAIAVKVGDKVSEGQEVATMESMKMQNALKSSMNGIVKTVNVKVGDSVSVDEIIMEFTPLT